MFILGLGLLGILGLGGVGAGIAGGLGYGFGIRYGFERIFPSFQQGGPQAAIKTAASDIATLLGTEGFDAGGAEVDTFLGNVAGDPDPTDDFNLDEFTGTSPDDAFIGPRRPPITPPVRQVTGDKCDSRHARWRRIMSDQAANETVLQRLYSETRSSSGNQRVLARKRNELEARYRARDKNNAELNAALNNPNNADCAATFRA